MVLGTAAVVGAGAGAAYLGYKHKQKKDEEEMHENLHEAAEQQKLNRDAEKKATVTTEE